MKEKIGEGILKPCKRDGGEDDWWGEQHKHCTGSHSVGATGYIKCTCECHTRTEIHAGYVVEE